MAHNHQVVGSNPTPAPKKEGSKMTLTLDKAIEILNDILHYVKPGDPPDEHDASKLGEEALKAIKLQRQDPDNNYIDALPGEKR